MRQMSDVSTLVMLPHVPYHSIAQTHLEPWCCGEIPSFLARSIKDAASCAAKETFAEEASSFTVVIHVRESTTPGLPVASPHVRPHSIGMTDSSTQ